MGAAYCCKEFVEACQARGWDYSVSVTAPCKKAPLLRILEEAQVQEWEWRPLDERGYERAVTVMHRPAGWAAMETYVVIRRDRDGAQLLLKPAHAVILVSRADLGLAEVVRRHRGKQGQENAFKGPLTELGLHHPPCKAYNANQAFYWCGQLAQLLLKMLQYKVLPVTARGHGLGPLIRDFVRSVGLLRKQGRQWTMLFGRSNHRLDWLLRPERLEPG